VGYHPDGSLTPSSFESYEAFQRHRQAQRWWEGHANFGDAGCAELQNAGLEEYAISVGLPGAKILVMDRAAGEAYAERWYPIEMVPIFAKGQAL